MYSTKKSTEVTGISYFLHGVTVTGTSYFFQRGTEKVTSYFYTVTSKALDRADNDALQTQ